MNTEGEPQDEDHPAPNEGSQSTTEFVEIRRTRLDELKKKSAEASKRARELEEYVDEIVEFLEDDPT